MAIPKKIYIFCLDNSSWTYCSQHELCERVWLCGGGTFLQFAGGIDGFCLAKPQAKVDRYLFKALHTLSPSNLEHFIFINLLPGF